MTKKFLKKKHGGAELLPRKILQLFFEDSANK